MVDSTKQGPKRKRTELSATEESSQDDEDSRVTQIDVPPNAEVPAHSVKVRFKLKRIEVSVHLLRTMPVNAISLNPSASEFYMDTFKHTKKYYLRCVRKRSEQQHEIFDLTPTRFKYPQGVKVDAEKAEAELLYGILKVTIPVTEIIDKLTGKKVCHRYRFI